MMERGSETKWRILMTAGAASKVVMSMPLVIAVGFHFCTKFADEPLTVTLSDAGECGLLG